MILRASQVCSESVAACVLESIITVCCVAEKWLPHCPDLKSLRELIVRPYLRSVVEVRALYLALHIFAVSAFLLCRLIPSECFAFQLMWFIAVWLLTG
jgi:hypothetical protein